MIIRRATVGKGVVVALAVLLAANGVGIWDLRAPVGSAVAAPRGVTAPLRSGQIDTRASRVFIHVGKTGLGHEHAVVGKLSSGELHLGATRDAGRLVFQMKSFAADRADARKYLGLEGTTSASTQRKVDANMLGPAVLNVRKYPTAEFRVASASRLEEPTEKGQARYRLQGDFTLHGTTRPLTVDAVAVAQGKQTRVRGAFRVKQTDFGITPFSKAFGTIGVADTLVIYGELYVAADGGLSQQPRPARR